MLPLPMLAFSLEGEDSYIELTIEEVWGYPNETSYGGGYGAKGKLTIKEGEYSVNNAAHYFTTGELYKFLQELQQCYEKLEGVAYLGNTEHELDLKCTFNRKGHVVINGRFQSRQDIETILIFEIRSEQTQILAAIFALKAVVKIFGDDKGNTGK
jgi:hypothetical protein